MRYCAIVTTFQVHRSDCSTPQSAHHHTSAAERIHSRPIRFQNAHVFRIHSYTRKCHILNVMRSLLYNKVSVEAAERCIERS